MRLFFGPSIPRQLSLTLVALVSSCLLLVGSFLIVISFTFEIKQLRQIQSVEARIISAEVDGYIDDLQRKIFYLSRIRGLTGFDKGVLQSLLEALINQNKAFELAGMTDRLGNLQLSHSPYGRTIPLDWSATAAFRRSFRGGEDFFGQVELEGLDTQPSLLLSAPIRDAHNAIAGMIFARIRLDYLRAVLDETKKVRGGYAYILDARGLVIGRSGSQSGVFSLDRLTPERLQGIAIDSPENTHSYNGLNGQRVLGQLAFVGSTNWRVLVELPLGEAYAPALRLMRLMGFGLLFGLCASIMLGTVLARRINRPLELLCLAALRLEQGELDARVDVPRSRELRIVAEAFNHMAERLGDSLALYRLISENTEDVIWTMDPESGRFTYVSPSVLKQRGYTADEVMALPMAEALTPDSLSRAADLLLERKMRFEKQAGESLFFLDEIDQKRKDGSIVNTEVASTFMRDGHGKLEIIGVSRDISERKRIEEKLMSSLAEARRFRDTLDHVSDYIFMKDSEYRYVYANKHTLKLFGCTAQDLLGKDDSSFFDPASLERVRQGDSRAMAGEEVNEEIDLNLPGGRRVVYREAKVPIYESAGIGEITGLLGIASDITAQKELEESLRQALAENKALLQELQHRVKNSFNMIAGLISLSTTKDMSEDTRSALAELGTRVGSVSELYSFLYSMGNFTELRLDEYCQRVGTSLLSLSTTILLDFDMESLVVSAKLAAPVGLILTEPITNSLKYAFRDGRRGSITIGLKRGADGAVLSVRDGGAGLPSGFDPSSSTGLGLRLVRGLCGQIQGHFEMSADAGGTVCVLEFPIEGGPGGS